MCKTQSNFRGLVARFLPPILTSALLRRLHGGNRFLGEYASWHEAVAKSSGYDDEAILEKALAAARAVRDGRAAFERDTVTFDEFEYVWPVVAALALSAARNRGTLRVMDFGGALGSSYYQYRRILSAILEVSWCVVEQPHFVQMGNSEFSNDQLKFYSSIEECIGENVIDIALLSGALQYVESPFDILHEIEGCGAKLMIIDRIPLALSDHEYVTIQHVPDWIYRASYPMHVFASGRLLSSIEGEWSVVSWHDCPEGRVWGPGKEDIRFAGVLLERRSQRHVSSPVNADRLAV